MLRTNAAYDLLNDVYEKDKDNIHVNAQKALMNKLGWATTTVGTAGSPPGRGGKRKLALGAMSRREGDRCLPVQDGGEGVLQPGGLWGQGEESEAFTETAEGVEVQEGGGGVAGAAGQTVLGRGQVQGFSAD